MEFLVDASLPRPTAELIRSQGYPAIDVRDVGLGAAIDEEVAQYARDHRLCLMTRDQDFGNVLNYPPSTMFGIVVINAPDAASRSLVLDMMQHFLGQTEIVEALERQLAVVELGRVRVRSG